ncbi:MAG TPA: hypothetical protein VGJ06_16270 [Candidatus Acidoferrum sp.]|jgi:hypothetical protein
MRQVTCTLNEVDVNTSLRVFQNLPLAVGVWQLLDPKDVRSLRFIGANLAAERELGAKIGYAVGKPIAECFPNLLGTRAPEIFRRVAISRKPETLGELSYRDARIDGVFWVECFPLPARCIGLTFENITAHKQLNENQSQALGLVHRITVQINESTSVFEAGQFCVDEICTQIGSPVGRMFLTDETSFSRFLPNPVWHFSDVPRFRTFRTATELYERDLSNKLALEHRATEARRAGLKRSIGFSILENNLLRGVLEFSWESVTPLDDNFVRAISNAGIQLGRVFERERASRAYECLENRTDDKGEAGRGQPKIRACSSGADPRSAASLAELRRNRALTRAASQELRESIQHLRSTMAETRRVMGWPVVEGPPQIPLPALQDCLH